MGSARSTVGDVARAAGVTPSTVSRTLNRPDRVSTETRERVLRAVEEVGYIPNAAARALRVGSSKAFGLVLLGFGNPFFVDIADAVEAAALEHGAVVALYSSGRDEQREQRLLQRLGERQLDGLIVTPLDVDDPLLDVLVARGTPVVVLLREVASGRHCSVRGDDVLGGRLAGQHLLDGGHRRLAYAGVVRTERYEGAAAVWERGRADFRWFQTVGADVEDGVGVVERLAAMPAAQRPTAVFCENDLIAVGVVQEARRIGLSVPEDLAVVGFDDTLLASAASAVGLTTVRQPGADMARAALALLLEEVEAGHERHREVLFKPELIVRASSGVPAPAMPKAPRRRATRAKTPPTSGS